MNRYQKGKIYKLVNDADDQIYIGSSCLDLPKRFYMHKSAAKLGGNRKVYKHLNTIGWEYVHIILVESFSCLNKMELEKRERYWIDTLSPSLNTAMPARTDAERSAILCKNHTKFKAKYRTEQCYKCDACDSWVHNNTRLSHEQLDTHQRNVHKQAIMLKIRSEGDNKYNLCDSCNCLVSKTSTWSHKMSDKHQNNLKNKQLKND